MAFFLMPMLAIYHTMTGMAVPERKNDTYKYRRKSSKTQQWADYAVLYLNKSNHGRLFHKVISTKINMDIY
jgi:hypothetical protein